MGALDSLNSMYADSLSLSQEVDEQRQRSLDLKEFLNEMRKYTTSRRVAFSLFKLGCRAIDDVKHTSDEIILRECYGIGPVRLMKLREKLPYEGR